MADKRCRECHMTAQHKLQCSRRNEPLAVESPRSLFPPEVVGRIKNPTPEGYIGHLSFEEGKRQTLSIIADYLRSEEARERVRDAVLSNSGGSLGTVVTAVISALLGEKE